ncbi:MAG TPA: uroporphyrinogen decarboxylase family protein, partial [Clostridia bacterium]|nr:uroporphyrinogen decarboxylase family protein [Clostridia bacterium]
VKKRTLQLLEDTKDFKNFIVSSGCDIPPGTPIENMDAFFEAVEEFNAGNS